MNKIFNLSLIILIFIFFSCSKKNNIPAPKKSENTLFNTEVTNKDSTSLIKENNNKIEKNIEEIISVDSITTNNNKIEVTNTNFYELEKSIEKILLKISFLEKQLLLNEDSAPSTSFAEKLKTLIDGPPEKHQILLKNESIIEGFIEKDNETNLLVMTSVGRLTIDKNEIEFIEKITT